MFGGWRLANSFEDMQQLGSGVLVIDVLSQECRLNGRPIRTLSIAFELQAWLLRDLRQHHIPLSSVRAAVVKADVCFPNASTGEAAESYLEQRDDGPTKNPGWILAARCRSEITTDETSYRSEYDTAGWPLAGSDE
jgi:hypothetical protein